MDYTTKLSNNTNPSFDVKRDKERQKAAEDYCNNLIGEATFGMYVAHKAGSKWADEHPHWISVKEELPPQGECVLVTNGKSYWQNLYSHKEKGWAVNDTSVTHWMPLPPPPKEGGEE